MLPIMKKISVISGLPVLVFVACLFLTCKKSSDSSNNNSSNNTTTVTCNPPATCKNGIQDAGETGVDCGGASCNQCPSGVISSGQLMAIVDGCLWTATHTYIYMGNNSFILECSSTSPADSVYLAFSGTPTYGVQQAINTSGVTISGTTYSSSFGGYITITDSSNSKITGTFHFSGTNGTTKYVSSGVIKSVPFVNH